MMLVDDRGAMALTKFIDSGAGPSHYELIISDGHEDIRSHLPPQQTKTLGSQARASTHASSRW